MTKGTDDSRESTLRFFRRGNELFVSALDLYADIGPTTDFDNWVVGTFLTLEDDHERVVTQVLNTQGEIQEEFVYYSVRAAKHIALKMYGNRFGLATWKKLDQFERHETETRAQKEARLRHNQSTN